MYIYISQIASVNLRAGEPREETLGVGAPRSARRSRGKDTSVSWVSVPQTHKKDPILQICILFRIIGCFINILIWRQKTQQINNLVGGVNLHFYKLNFKLNTFDYKLHLYILFLFFIIYIYIMYISLYFLNIFYIYLYIFVIYIYIKICMTIMKMCVYIYAVYILSNLYINNIYKIYIFKIYIYIFVHLF